MIRVPPYVPPVPVQAPTPLIVLALRRIRRLKVTR